MVLNILIFQSFGIINYNLKYFFLKLKSNLIDYWFLCNFNIFNVLNTKIKWNSLHLSQTEEIRGDYDKIYILFKNYFLMCNNYDNIYYAESTNNFPLSQLNFSLIILSFIAFFLKFHNFF